MTAGRAAQRLLRHDPAAGTKQARDLAEGPHRVGLVHEEKPRVSQVERAAHRCRVELVDVTSKHLHVAQLQRGLTDRARWTVGSLRSTPTARRPGPPSPP